MLFGINLPFERLSQYEGQVGYALLTRAPVVSKKQAPLRPLDLHVLSLQLAFILSQDQTLRCKLYLLMPQKRHHFSNCLYWPEISYINLKLTVRFSFLTLHFTDNQKISHRCCTACLYGMFSRIICLNGMQPSLFAESEYKGKANFRTTKIFQGYF